MCSQCQNEQFDRCLGVVYEYVSQEWMPCIHGDWNIYGDWNNDAAI